MNTVQGRVSECGRLNIAAEFRKAVGLEHSGNVVIELVGREIRIRTVDEAVAQAQAIARRLTAGNPDASVDAFLAKRIRSASRPAQIVARYPAWSTRH
jgi:hypothetical protein